MAWEQLLSIRARADDDHREFRDAIPVACPFDGYPLKPGPEGSGILFCPAGDWEYPRDHVQPL
jgi:hypothetical protein